MEVPPHPAMRLPANTRKSSKESLSRVSRPRDRPPTLQASITEAFTTMCVAQDHGTIGVSLSSERQERTKTHSHSWWHAVESPVFLYRMCSAHPMLASTFTQGAPAAQDFPSFHQGLLSFNLLPFQRKGNRIFLVSLSHS